MSKKKDEAESEEQTVEVAAIEYDDTKLSKEERAGHQEYRKDEAKVAYVGPDWATGKEAEPAAPPEPGENP